MRLRAEPGSVRLRPTGSDSAAFGLVAAIGVGFFISLGPTGTPVGLVAGLALVSTSAALCWLSTRDRHTDWSGPWGPWLFVVAVAVLRDLAGGTGSRFTLLMALPVVWLGLFGRRWQLGVGAGLILAAFLVPWAVIGPPRYATNDWQRGVQWFVFAAVVGPILQQVVSFLTDHAERLQHVVDQADAMTRGATMASMIATDLDGGIVGFNQGAERLLGYTSEEVRAMGMTLLDLHIPAEIDQVAAEIASSGGFATLVALAEAEADSRIWTYVRSDASQIFVRNVITPLSNAAGIRTGYLSMAIDATTAIQTRRELIVAREHSDRLFEDSPQAIALVDARTGVIVRLNAACADLFEETPESLPGRSLADLSEPGTDTLTEHLAGLLTSPTGRSRAEWTLARRGVVRHLILSSTLLDAPESDVGDVRQALVTISDISERFHFEQQLAHLADHDPLTGLANRRLFNRELARHVEFCRRYGPRGAVLVLDLDHFKEVNDTLGHAAGDQLIVSVAGVLRRTVRSTDTVARIGGDEFAILLLETDSEGAERVAQAVVDAIQQYVSTLDGHRRNVTVSVGAVVLDSAERSGGDLLADADMTMYDAKEAGRNRYSILDYSTFQEPRMAARMAWILRIREAIATDQFTLHLQPVQDIRTGRITGAEALLRLNDPGGLIYPNEFLYVAERSDLIVELDTWVVRQSIELLSRLQAIEPGFSLEINASGRSIGHPELEAALISELGRHKVDPTGLVLEITETAAVADVDMARAFAERVIALGCRFALDDFGAGFGSFYYLKHLLFDYVKIDGEFIANIDTNPADRVIVRSIVDMSRGLGKQTIAEFVSSASIYDIVRQEGVDYAQGYHVGRPVDVPTFLRELTASVDAGDAARPSPRPIDAVD